MRRVASQAGRLARKIRKPLFQNDFVQKTMLAIAGRSADHAGPVRYQDVTSFGWTRRFGEPSKAQRRKRAVDSAPVRTSGAGRPDEGA